MSGICESCGQPSTLLCDGRVIDDQRVPLRTATGVGTCDTPICKACAKRLSTYHLRPRTDKGRHWNSINLCPKCVAVNPEAVANG